MASEAAEKLPPWPPVLVWTARILIAAVALYDLKLFTDYLPFQGPGSGNLMNLLDWFSIYVMAPLGGIAALVLAAMNKRLMLAAILALMTPVYWALSVVAFGIGVMIYGF